MVGPLLGLAFTAGWVCLFAKRLHDLGLSGWLQTPAHLMSLSIVVTALASLPFRIKGLLGHPVSGFDVVTGSLTSLAFSAATTSYGIGAAFALILTLVLGVAPGQRADNAYGPAVRETPVQGS